MGFSLRPRAVFAVVADEVRKLAERSQRETKAISELIRGVQAGTRDAVKAMQGGSAQVEAGSQKADQAGKVLDEILGAVDVTVADVSEIASAAQQMAQGARSVVDVMESIRQTIEQSASATREISLQTGEVAAATQSIAAIAEENSAATEEVLASSEEMGAQVDAMTVQAEDLARTAEQLQALVARFHAGLDADAEAALDTDHDEQTVIPAGARMTGLRLTLTRSTSAGRVDRTGAHPLKLRGCPHPSIFHGSRSLPWERGSLCPRRDLTNPRRGYLAIPLPGTYVPRHLGQAPLSRPTGSAYTGLSAVFKSWLSRSGVTPGWGFQLAILLRRSRGVRACPRCSWGSTLAPRPSKWSSSPAPASCSPGATPARTATHAAR